MVKNILHASACITLLLCCTVLFGSCANSTDRTDEGPTFNEENITYSYDADISNYQTDIQKLLKINNSDYLKQIISDNIVSADEMNEFQNRVRKCYADEGFDFVQTNESGAGSLARLDGQPITGRDTHSEDALQRCNYDTGYGMLAPIYSQATANPDNIDTAPYIVQCLIDHRLVDESYTVDELTRDTRQRTGPYAILDEEGSGSDRGKQIYDCGRDPLGKLR